jgi:hypothetical protein
LYFFFQLEEDALNYVEANLYGLKLRLKPDAVPHIFTCQEKGADKNKRIRMEKRKQKKMLHEIFNEHVIADLTQLKKYPGKKTTQAVTASTSTEELSNQDPGFDETDSDFICIPQQFVQCEINNIQGI